MIAFKWLAKGAVAPFSGVRWPRSGWVCARGAKEGDGVHACRVAHLPWWLDAELWRIELEGPFIERETQIEGWRGRLLEQVTAWDPDAFARACAARAAAFAAESRTPELLEYASAARAMPAAPAAYVAAVAAVAARGGIAAFGEERAWQAQWLARSLGLTEG